MSPRFPILALLSLIAACGEAPIVAPVQPSTVLEAPPSFDHIPGHQVFKSGGHVDTWNAIVPAQIQTWETSVCVPTPAVGLNANWTNPHKAFVANNAEFQKSVQNRNIFHADWINAWPGYEWYDLTATWGGPPGSLQQSWTRYSTPVSGTGDFVVSLAADNCSWIYITNPDGSNPVLVGVQFKDARAMAPAEFRYPVRLNGNHRLEFLVFDGGGQSGGMFRLETNSGQVTFTDTDGDGLADIAEINVHGTSPTNPDTDGDGVNDGDEVAAGTDPKVPQVVDTDGDGVKDTADNCPTTSNPDQRNTDGDAQGDACDPDDDNDGDIDDADNCPAVSNADQANFDGDAMGDACDPDDDNDGQPDATDAFPYDRTRWVADTDGPVITPTVTGSLGANGWYTSDVSVSWDVTDPNSPIIGKTNCEATSVTADTNGQTFTCTANSHGGQSTQSVTVKRDATRPTVTSAVAGTLGSNGWYTSDVTVSWTTSDAMSGMATSCAPVTRSTDTPGQQYDCSVRDNAGNPASATVSIKRDATKPSVTSDLAGTLGTNGWYRSDVTVTWTTTDGMSGMAGSCPAATQSTDTPGTAHECTVADNAGNTASASVSVKRDATAPTAVASVSGAPGNEGWYVGDVTIAFETGDPMSGVASSAGCATTVLSTDTGGITYACSVTDNAGNTGTASASVKRDATKPMIGYTPSSGSYTVDQTVSIACAASDALSGRASDTCADVNGAAYTFAIGTHTRSATVTDVAGNTNAASVSFTVSVTNGSLCTLVKRWVSQAGVAQSMCKQLENGAYGAFRNHVEAQSGKTVSAEHADILIALSHKL